MLEILPILFTTLFITEGLPAADCDKQREYEKGSIPTPPSDNLGDAIRNEWNVLMSGKITPGHVAERTVGIFKLAANGWKNILSFRTPEGTYVNSCGKNICYPGYRGSNAVEASFESGFLFHNGRLLTGIK